jgi:hypothetical protein
MCNAVHTVRLCELRVARSTLGYYIGKCIETSKPIVKATEINVVRRKEDYVTLLDKISTLPLILFYFLL